MKLLAWIVDIAAFVWTHRPQVIETAGAASLVVAGAMVAAPLGWTVAGVALLAKSLELDAKLRRKRDQ